MNADRPRIAVASNDENRAPNLSSRIRRWPTAGCQLCSRCRRRARVWRRRAQPGSTSKKINENIFNQNEKVINSFTILPSTRIRRIDHMWNEPIPRKRMRSPGRHNRPERREEKKRKNKNLISVDAQNRKYTRFERLCAGRKDGKIERRS